ncbi:hypothetical protein EH221_00220 [bacterium]|nr:MAG: hypothetical protein EH221_00220 [bacterium]
MPYTVDEGEGVFLFVFYLLLGHTARLTGFSLIFIFHSARLLSAVIFLIALRQFLNKINLADIDLTEPRSIQVGNSLFAYSCILSCFGSGFGWLASSMGKMTADFWVAEAFPFLSAFTSPHFTLGMALLLFLLSFHKKNGLKNTITVWIIGCLLALVMPFGAVVGGIVLALSALWDWYKTRHLYFYPALSVLMGAGLILSIQYWKILNDPYLSDWNQQNITISPSIVDLVVSYSPALFMAAVGTYYIWRRNRLQEYGVLLLWFFSSILLTVIPFSLQRRFMFAQYLPIAILAVQGLRFLPKKQFRSAFILLLVFSILTNILLLMSGVLAVRAGNPRLVLSSDEREMLDWIDSHLDENAVILCSPEMGNFVPAYTDSKVLYGHPFETVNAKQMEMYVTSFFDGSMGLDGLKSIVDEYQVTYILYGPRERELGTPDAIDEFKMVHRNETISLYEVGADF